MASIINKVRTWDFLLFAGGLFCLYQNQTLIRTQGIVSIGIVSQHLICT